MDLSFSHVILLTVFCLPPIIVSESTSYHVSPALGSRPGARQMVRVSAVRHKAAFDPSEKTEWDYVSQFQVRWPDFHLATRLVNVSALGTEVAVDKSNTLPVRMPCAGAGTRALVFGDPNIRETRWSREAGWNVWGDLADLLDAAAESIDLVVILGDVFYDHGYTTLQQWWSELSLRAQSIPVVAVPGNHDFWKLGAPYRPKRLILGNQGYAFMQMFGMDSVATVANPQVFNYSRASFYGIADWSNFFHYSIVGNMGLIAFSGAHSFEEQAAAFREACEFMTVERPRMVLLASHWDRANYGGKLSCPDAYDILTGGGEGANCSGIRDSIVYLMGHSHVNVPIEGDKGFVLGASGMGSDHWGFSVFDTTGSQNQVTYFEMANTTHSSATDIISCMRSKGVGYCQGTAWTPSTFK